MSKLILPLIVLLILGCSTIPLCSPYFDRSVYGNNTQDSINAAVTPICQDNEFVYYHGAE